MTETVVERIVDAIARGQFPAGSRLIEANLARRFGVSRGPIREALRLVAVDGLVRITAGRGIFVIDPSAEDLERMILVRALLEGCAARLFVLTHDSEARERLRDIVARMRTATATNDIGGFPDLHWQFHETVCRSAGNNFLLRAWLSLRSTYRVFGRLNLGSRLALPDVLKTHETLLAVLCDDDADRAEATFRSLIMRGGYANLGKEIPQGLKAYALSEPV